MTPEPEVEEANTSDTRYNMLAPPQRASSSWWKTSQEKTQYDSVLAIGVALTIDVRRKDKFKAARTFACEGLNCNIRPFSSKADLLRHQREVHRRDELGRWMEVYRCPVQSCQRSTRGFARLWNLNEHCRRVHSLSSTTSSRDKPVACDSESRSIAKWTRSVGVFSQDLPDVIPSGKFPLMQSEKFSDFILEDLRAHLYALQSHRDSIVYDFNSGISAIQKVIEGLEK